MFLGKQMSSPNGDIAYHFYLDDQDEIFEEGQVVGFVPSKNDPDRKQVIVKLNFETASQAILKGVVTRSQYFEAKCPHKSGERPVRIPVVTFFRKVGQTLKSSEFELFTSQLFKLFASYLIISMSPLPFYSK